MKRTETVYTLHRYGQMPVSYIVVRNVVRTGDVANPVANPPH